MAVRKRESYRGLVFMIVSKLKGLLYHNSGFDGNRFSLLLEGQELLK